MPRHCVPVDHCVLLFLRGPLCMLGDHMFERQVASNFHESMVEPHITLSPANKLIASTPAPTSLSISASVGGFRGTRLSAQALQLRGPKAKKSPPLGQWLIHP